MCMYVRTKATAVEAKTDDMKYHYSRKEPEHSFQIDIDFIDRFWLLDR